MGKAIPSGTLRCYCTSNLSSVQNLPSVQPWQADICQHRSLPSANWTIWIMATWFYLTANFPELWIWTCYKLYFFLTGLKISQTIMPQPWPQVKKRLFQPEESLENYTVMEELLFQDRLSKPFAKSDLFINTSIVHPISSLQVWGTHKQHIKTQSANICRAFGLSWPLPLLLLNFCSTQLVNRNFLLFFFFEIVTGRPINLTEGLYPPNLIKGNLLYYFQELLNAL